MKKSSPYDLKDRDITEDIAVVDTIVMFMNNVNRDAIFGVAYGETEDFKHHANYREEKIDVFKTRHLVGLWPMLDGVCRERLVRAAMEKYHGECYEAVTINAKKAKEEELEAIEKRILDGEERKDG